MTEEQARLMLPCPNCGGSKSKGCVVCWECFKYIDNPFKYSELSFEEWLKQQKESL